MSTVPRRELGSIPPQPLDATIFTLSPLPQCSLSRVGRKGFCGCSFVFFWGGGAVVSVAQVGHGFIHSNPPLSASCVELQV